MDTAFQGGGGGGGGAGWYDPKLGHLPLRNQDDLAKK